MPVIREPKPAAIPDLALRRAVDRALVRLQFCAYAARLFGDQAVERKDIAFVPKLIDLRLGEDLEHVGPPFE